MKTTRITAIAALIATTGLALHVALAQPVGARRIDLQRHDLSITGREVVQTIVELAPGTTAPRHTHPGEEIIYVLEGTWEYTVEGKPPVILKAGDVLFIPAGTIHSARNVGTGRAAELATYIVEKGSRSSRWWSERTVSAYASQGTALTTHDRRRFLGTAAMTLAAAHLGTLSTVNANDGGPRELAAIGRAAEWLNSPRLTPSSLTGKVVLVDFWTYTCINWLRTLPYLRAWVQKYRQGLVVIGVHTPEFEFEKNVDNVRRAVRQMRIDYPVVIDNDYSIWRAFNNHSWPALYFIDARGRVRQHHVGEGEYDRSEMAIQRLLAEAGVGGPRDGGVSVDANGVEAAADWDNLRSPENYVGYERTENFASPGGAERDRRRVYAAPRAWRSINGR